MRGVLKMIKRYFTRRINVIWRITNRIKMIVLSILMVVLLVGSNTINDTLLDANTQALHDCLITGTADCQTLSITPQLPTPIPEINGTEIERFLSAIATNLTNIPQPGTYEYILLRAYGAAFVNHNLAVQLPVKVLFNNEEETQAFQENLTMVKVNGTNDCYLQAAAAAALNQARSQQNIPLKSGYGSGDCTRSFATNLRFWNQYANQNTLDKVRAGKETAILSVVAPPGTSQHLWGLAIDLRVSQPKQRQALYENGWFQTVVNDIPHWTYLGLTEDDLLALGLKKQVEKGISYWVTPI
ncbi:D-alanyl-D-alanine carboxypeptidase [Nostoc sp. PCC 7524]|nr:D-alanyl-D-alanine carboxypeptidase [Nostoc sp. PCC 7524]